MEETNKNISILVQQTCTEEDEDITTSFSDETYVLSDESRQETVIKFSPRPIRYKTPVEWYGFSNMRISEETSIIFLKPRLKKYLIFLKLYSKLYSIFGATISSFP